MENKTSMIALFLMLRFLFFSFFLFAFVKLIIGSLYPATEFVLKQFNKTLQKDFTEIAPQRCCTKHSIQRISGKFFDVVVQFL